MHLNKVAKPKIINESDCLFFIFFITCLVSNRILVNTFIHVECIGFGIALLTMIGK